MKRVLILLYGVVSYFAFLSTFMYFIGFVGNLTPIAIDSPRTGQLGTALLFVPGLAGVKRVAAEVMERWGEGATRRLGY